MGVLELLPFVTLLVEVSQSSAELSLEAADDVVLCDTHRLPYDEGEADVVVGSRAAAHVEVVLAKAFIERLWTVTLHQRCAIDVVLAMDEGTLRRVASLRMKLANGHDVVLRRDVVLTEGGLAEGGPILVRHVICVFLSVRAPEIVHHAVCGVADGPAVLVFFRVFWSPEASRTERCVLHCLTLGSTSVAEGLVRCHGKGTIHAHDAMLTHAVKQTSSV